MQKEKYSIEFVLGNVSQKSLWHMLIDPSSLELWFADKVEVRDDRFYTFTWDDNIMEVERVKKKPNEYVRYNWLSPERLGTYFEFKIHKLELSGMIALEVIDFVHTGDKKDAILLWETQIETFKRKLGI